MKIHSVWAKPFYADARTSGETDRHAKANNHFTKFCERA